MQNQKQKLVVFDIDIPQLMENRLFNSEMAEKVSHTILPVCELYKLALSNGIEFVTQDVFFRLKYKPKSVLLISALVTPNTEKLIQAGVRPIILSCLESPFIATKFYLNLKKYSSWYKYSIVFSGMQGHLSAKTQYKKMYIPTIYNPDYYKPLPFAEKKYLTMISGNKRMGNWKKDLLLKLFYGFNVKEIYSLRQEVINFFADSGKFDLFGIGWDRGGASEFDTQKIKKVYRGAVKEKLSVLNQYKFTFCFENTIFPGYVTEKIFDAMFAGSVPVYLGAPDVNIMLPQATFVDIRKFKNLRELDAFLSAMPEPVYQTYLANIQSFLGSSNYKKFSYQTYNNEILNILKQEF